jgi:hypothetical protein
MKTKFSVLMVLMLILVQGCSAGPKNDIPSPQPQVAPVIITAEPESTLPALGEVSTATESPQGSAIIPEGGITLDDNGKTFTMHVGDSVLLNLGMDVYEWEVTVDNQDVLRMKMGVMVIKGAQGIYDALAPGTATLSASGNPLCLQSRPACAMPSILFSVTIVVN